MNPETLMLVVIAVIIVTGLLLVRSARKPKPPVKPGGPTRAAREPDRICSDAHCRHHNPGQAAYCGQCGRSLKSA
jgi:hypothetical protein